MNKSTIRVVGLVAALLAATAAAAPVPCESIDALWQDEAAVAGNFPECESFYDGSNPEQAAEVDPEHPDMKRFALNQREENIAPGNWPPRRGSELSARGNWPPQSAQKRNEQTINGNWPPRHAERAEQQISGNWPPRSEQSVQGNWPPSPAYKRAVQEPSGNWPPRSEQSVQGNWPPSPAHRRAGEETPGNWPPRRESESESEPEQQEGDGSGGDLCGLLGCGDDGTGPIGGLKDPGHAGEQ